MADATKPGPVTKTRPTSFRLPDDIIQKLDLIAVADRRGKSATLAVLIEAEAKRREAQEVVS